MMHIADPDEVGTDDDDFHTPQRILFIRTEVTLQLVNRGNVTKACMVMLRLPNSTDKKKIYYEACEDMLLSPIAPCHRLHISGCCGIF